MLTNDGRGREGQRQPQAADAVRPALPGEVDSEQREDEQAGVAGVERLVSSGRIRTPNSSGTLMATAAATARAKTTSGLGTGGALGGASSASAAMTSCFHNRSECSRANSRDSASRLPMRLTAMRNASSSGESDVVSAASWSRRWPSSSSTSGPSMRRRRRRYARHCAICSSSGAIGERRHAVHAFIQIPRRVSSTTCHCCRWAASCVRPSLVMR